MSAYCIIYKYDTNTIKCLLSLPTYLYMLLMVTYFDFNRNVLRGFKRKIVQICFFLPFIKLRTRPNPKQYRFYNKSDNLGILRFIP